MSFWLVSSLQEWNLFLYYRVHTWTITPDKYCLKYCQRWGKKHMQTKVTAAYFSCSNWNKPSKTIGLIHFLLKSDLFFQNFPTGLTTSVSALNKQYTTSSPSSTAATTPLPSMSVLASQTGLGQLPLPQMLMNATGQVLSVTPPSGGYTSTSTQGEVWEVACNSQACLVWIQEPFSNLGLGFGSGSSSRFYNTLGLILSRVSTSKLRMDSMCPNVFGYGT